MTFDDRILRDQDTGFIVDFHLGSMTDDIGLQEALNAMSGLESGALANADESRQVGHYWLRNTDIAYLDHGAVSRSCPLARRRSSQSE